MTWTQGRKWTEDEVRALIEKRATGWTPATIAGALGRKLKAVQMKLAELDQRRARAPEAPARLRPATRRCLGCGYGFDSTHCGNRLCERCKAAADRDAPGMIGGGFAPSRGNRSAAPGRSG